MFVSSFAFFVCLVLTAICEFQNKVSLINRSIGSQDICNPNDTPFRSKHDAVACYVGTFLTHLAPEFVRNEARLEKQ